VAVDKSNQPAVGNGDAMSVSTEIAQHVFCARPKAVWSRRPSRDGTVPTARRRRRAVPQAVRDVRGTGVRRHERRSSVRR
jgi:hypothetical protein